MPISYIARFNLMQVKFTLLFLLLPLLLQVAQILQVLALWKWEEIQPQHQVSRVLTILSKP